MTNTAINDAENTTEVAPAEQTQTEVTSVDSVQPETTTKKRNTTSKGKTTDDSTKAEMPEEIKATDVPETASNTEDQAQGTAETEVNTSSEVPEEIKAAAPETAPSAENQEHGPAEAEVKASADTPEDIPKQADDVKASHPPEAFLNRFNSKRKLEVKNNGPRSFEIFTNTPLPAGQTVVLELENDHLYRMVVSKFTQLNRMAGKERYTVKEV